MTAVLATLAAALVTGLTGSLHCALMCGPLACATLPVGAGRIRAAAAWHAGRIVAYAGVGAVLGGVGAGVGKVLATSIQPVLPWVMAAGLVATALDLGRWMKPIPGVARVALALSRFGNRLSPALKSAATGAATPFLPCGLLYGIYVAAIATGSSAVGAAVMGSFAVGGAAALAGAQAGFGAWKGRPWIRRSVLLMAAAVLVWRAAVQTGEGPPACH